MSVFPTKYFSSGDVSLPLSIEALGRAVGEDDDGPIRLRRLSSMARREGGLDARSYLYFGHVIMEKRQMRVEDESGIKRFAALDFEGRMITNSRKTRPC
ncbi:hypothetical protein J2S06_001649 [Bacillus alveayuensis]|uniref:Uncharacterized protein n=1 Tax=Aeribacillus alveayuensis TaxID=279215 RepID=A0ABT9VP09_9BACI|nr:hypothetical protein [Bacillus alveayuensis]